MQVLVGLQLSVKIGCPNENGTVSTQWSIGGRSGYKNAHKNTVLISNLIIKSTKEKQTDIFGDCFLHNIDNLK